MLYEERGRKLGNLYQLGKDDMWQHPTSKHSNWKYEACDQLDCCESFCLPLLWGSCPQGYEHNWMLHFRFPRRNWLPAFSVLLGWWLVGSEDWRPDDHVTAVTITKTLAGVLQHSLILAKFQLTPTSLLKLPEPANFTENMWYFIVLTEFKDIWPVSTIM